MPIIIFSPEIETFVREDLNFHTLLKISLYIYAKIGELTFLSLFICVHRQSDQGEEWLVATTQLATNLSTLVIDSAHDTQLHTPHYTDR